MGNKSGITRNMNDRATLIKQKNILEMREAYLRGVSDSESRHRIDHETMVQLRAMSSAGLPPVLIQRNNSDWIAAFLIQDIGDQGKRILFRGGKWRIFRARKSAQLLPLDEDDEGLMCAFDVLVRAQEHYYEQLANLLGRNKAKVQVKPTRKAKACPKIKASTV